MGRVAPRPFADESQPIPGEVADAVQATVGEDPLAGPYERRRLRGHTGWVNSAIFSPDGQRILTGSADETAQLWMTPDLYES